MNNLKVIDISNTNFYNSIAKGLSLNEIKIVDGEILFTPHLFLKSLGIIDSDIDCWSKVLKRTKNKRIKNKYNNKIYFKFNSYYFNLY